MTTLLVMKYAFWFWFFQISYAISSTRR